MLEHQDVCLDHGFPLVMQQECMQMLACHCKCTTQVAKQGEKSEHVQLKVTSRHIQMAQTLVDALQHRLQENEVG